MRLRTRGPWKKLDARLVSRHRIFDLYDERFVSPRTGNECDAVVLHAADWVNVIALSADGACVMIRQFRYGNERETLEIPGGMIDPGESPLTAAKRELREETGYVASRWTALGSSAPNPAFLNNRLFTFLAEDAVYEGEQEQDSEEDIHVELMPEAAVEQLISGGELDHALVVVAFYKLALFRKSPS
jgi:8-oxo-dGTP pyrophosphatase MutT (NUDIX family)